MSTEIPPFPAVNAALNAISACLLLLGYGFIRKGETRSHVVCMLSAVVVSVLFLVSYLTYHALYGSHPFVGQGWVRPVYFTILISHMILAACIVPLVIKTLYHAAKQDLKKHVCIARITLPIWLYVSVTGVVVYFMLYHWF